MAGLREKQRGGKIFYPRKKVSHCLDGRAQAGRQAERSGRLTCPGRRFERAAQVEGGQKWGQYDLCSQII